MSTDELARRIRVLRDHLDALDRAERAWRERHDAARKRIADEIEAERTAADPTGLRAEIVGLIERRGTRRIESDAGGPRFTFGVPVYLGDGRRREWVEAAGPTEDEARERLIALVIARWQERVRMKRDAMNAPKGDG